MSFILEALQISEQMRGHGAVTPQLSLQPVMIEEMVPRHRWPYMLASLLLLNALVLFLWVRPGPPTAGLASLAARVTQPAATPVGVAPASAMQPATGQAAFAQVSRSMSGARAPVARSAPAATPLVAASAPTSAIDVAMAAPASAANPAQSMPVTTTKAAARKLPGGVAKIAATAEPVKASAAATGQSDETEPTGKLPLALQKELPTLSVSGFIRADGSEDMVLVNDRLLREGEEFSPGLKLEKTLADSVIFSYKGYRFKR